MKTLPQENTSVSATASEDSLVDDLRSSIVGIYTYSKFTSQLVSNLEKTMIFYYWSKPHFHVHPRREILTAILDLVNLIRELATCTPENLKNKFNSLLINAGLTDTIQNPDYQRPIKNLGNKIRVLWQEVTSITFIQRIVYYNYRCVYFKVGERRHIFSEVSRVIQKVNEANRQILAKLAETRAEQQLQQSTNIPQVNLIQTNEDERPTLQNQQRPQQSREVQSVENRQLQIQNSIEPNTQESSAQPESQENIPDRQISTSLQISPKRQSQPYKQKQQEKKEQKQEERPGKKPIKHIEKIQKQSIGSTILSCMLASLRTLEMNPLLPVFTIFGNYSS